jgi:hypothetical protein
MPGMLISARAFHIKDRRNLLRMRSQAASSHRKSNALPANLWAHMMSFESHSSVIPQSCVKQYCPCRIIPIPIAAAFALQRRCSLSAFPI